MKNLSEGEKMIYAAAFVSAIDRGRPHLRWNVRLPMDEQRAERARQEKELASQAAEEACAYVDWFRDAVNSVCEGWGDDHSVTEMVLDILR